MMWGRSTYQPFGDITSIMYGNGIVTTKTYNNRYQLNNLTLGTLKNLTYTRDNTGNITAIADNLNPNNTKSYTYDNLHRLTLATGSWGALTYAYDFVGNRTYETTNTGNTTYTYTTNTNKLASTSGEKAFNFNFDNNGNTTAENSRQYIYNQNQRLTGTVLGEYIYNGNGQRADKLIPSQNKCTVFHYDQNGLLISESTRTGNIKAEYVYLNGNPLAKIENNNVYYYHDDHLGTPMVMTDSSGSVVWSGEFLPFGEPLSVSGTITNNLRFPGQYYDAETGLHQNYFRDYKPEIGGYISEDPIGLAGGDVNYYAYVWNQPLRFKDPFGLLALEYLARAMTKITGATAQEAAIAGRMADAFTGAGLTIAGKEIPVNIRESVGYTLEGIQALGGIQSVSLGYAIATTSSVTPALPVVLALAGGLEIGSAFNQIYERISGQNLGADIYDLFHPEEAALLRRNNAGCGK